VHGVELLKEDYYFVPHAIWGRISFTGCFIGGELASLSKKNPQRPKKAIGGKLI